MVSNALRMGKHTSHPLLIKKITPMILYFPKVVLSHGLLWSYIVCSFTLELLQRWNHKIRYFHPKVVTLCSISECVSTLDAEALKTDVCPIILSPLKFWLLLINTPVPPFWVFALLLLLLLLPSPLLLLLLLKLMWKFSNKSLKSLRVSWLKNASNLFSRLEIGLFFIDASIINGSIMSVGCGSGFTGTNTGSPQQKIIDEQKITHKIWMNFIFAAFELNGTVPLNKHRLSDYFEYYFESVIILLRILCI